MELNKNEHDTGKHYLLGKLAGEDHDSNRRYLLGQLAGDDLETFEKRLLTDDEAFEELLAAEDDLVDQYVSGDLRGDERAVFEKKFLTTLERQQDVDFAHVLQKFLKQKASRRSPWPFTPKQQPWIFSTAAAVLVVSFIAVLFYLMARPSDRISNLPLIASGVTRGGEGSEVPKRNLHDFDVLKISLKLPEGFPQATSFRAELQGEASGTKAVKVISTDAQSITVQIPASELTPGRYNVKLYGIDAAGKENRVPGAYRFDIQ